MADFKVPSISIIMLGVQDLPRSLDFYRDKLGMGLRSEIRNDFAFLDGGGILLALSRPLAEATGQGAGAAEIVFAVEDVSAAYEALRNRGVIFSRTPHAVTGTQWAANFMDPDGHRLSIFGPEHASAPGK